MVSASPPQETFHWEQLAMLTDVCERDGFSSFCFTCHTAVDVRALGNGNGISRRSQVTMRQAQP